MATLIGRTWHIFRLMCEIMHDGMNYSQIPCACSPCELPSVSHGKTALCKWFSSDCFTTAVSNVQNLLQKKKKLKQSWLGFVRSLRVTDAQSTPCELQEYFVLHGNSSSCIRARARLTHTVGNKIQKTKNILFTYKKQEARNNHMT